MGGPSWNVGLGRRDSTTASKDAATKDIPSPLMDLSALISAFANKGFNAKEMVALAGKLELLSSWLCIKARLCMQHYHMWWMFFNEHTGAHYHMWSINYY